MMNNVMLVGRMVKEPEEKNGVCKITFGVKRVYKNEEGEYETDIISCDVSKTMSEYVFENLHKDDLIGIKGKLETENGNLKLSVEKMTFLSRRNNNEEI